MSNATPAPAVETAQVVSATAGQDKTATITAPFDGVVESVHIVPATALTGANTESRTVSVVNTDKAGTPSVASKAFTLHVNAPAGKETAITKSGTAANLEVSAGDELEVRSTHVGSTGHAGPAFEARIRFKATAEETEPDPSAVTVSLSTHVDAAAANADASGGFVEAPFDGVVTGVQITANAAITGADTESRTIQLFNRGEDGDGTVKVAEKAFVEDVNAGADDETDLTLTATTADRVVAKGDILEFFSLHVGTTGLAGPAFRGEVTFSRRRS